MQSSGNLNSSSSNVSRKVYFDIYSRVTLFQIILFIVGFNLMGYFSHIMVMLGTLGFIFGVQIFFFVNGLGFLVIFGVLYFVPPTRKGNRLSVSLILLSNAFALIFEYVHSLDLSHPSRK